VPLVMHSKTLFLTTIFSLLILVSIPDSAQAYIGPGAGFALVTSFFVIIASLGIALLSLLIWPIRRVWWMLSRKKAEKKALARKVIIVGLDGLDPDLTEKFMASGKLPNFSKFSQSGSFSRLETTFPAVSPVAWSSFATSVNPGKHNIFDFLTPNRKRYMAELSSVRIGSVRRHLNIGKYRIPLSKPEIKSLRKSKSFWNVLGEYGIFSTILRVPITFPAEKFHGTCLAAMCIPDLKGTQGSFTYYTTDSNQTGKMYEGERIYLERKGNVIEGRIPGPANPILRQENPLSIPFTVKIHDAEQVTLKLPDQKIALHVGRYSEWIKLQYKLGLGMKITGIVRMLVKSIEPHFSMYLTPINIDPEKPVLPVSHPSIFSIYHAKLQGNYATLGLAEDTWALNERIINEDEFIKQAYDIQADRETMFFNTLRNTKDGVVVSVFDITDRLQHMFIRFLFENHPAVREVDAEKYKYVIEDLYVQMDELLGRTMEFVDDDTVLLVMSDHGFKPFKWGFNVNSWLYNEGYLALKSGENSGEWFDNVDWSKTKAYCLGLAGIYLNIRDREAKGIVDADTEKAILKKELKEKLLQVVHPSANEPVFRDIFDPDEIYTGPYIENGPDLLLGFHEGYRVSWDSAIGMVSKDILEDNTKSWGGDHCVDPRIVPGVLFSNRPIAQDKPSITDIGATVLNVFGITPPPYMDGKNLFQKP
jgi:predicted AlkP superfamily phosphohydrolase/phosphomutase